MLAFSVSGTFFQRLAFSASGDIFSIWPFQRLVIFGDINF
jgi:hypothetical protein